MNHRLLAITSLLFTVLSPSFASTKVAKQDAQAILILSQSLTAMLGSAPTIQDTVVQATITLTDGTVGTLKVESKGSAESRHDIAFPSRALSYVMNNGQGYSLVDGKKANLPYWMTQYHYPDHIPAISQMSAFSLPNMNLTYVGLETVNGVPVHHILFTLLPTDGTPDDVAALISEFHVFVDAQTFFVIKTQSYNFSSEAVENRSLAEMYYSDYRSVDGLMVPYQISRYVSGDKICDIAFSSVALNVGLSDADFQ